MVIEAEVKALKEKIQNRKENIKMMMKLPN